MQHSANFGQQKYDMNNCGGISTDFIGGSQKYPEGNYTLRKQIWIEHLEYQQGLLWTQANDEQLPLEVRTEMSLWGLCGDEFEYNSLAKNWSSRSVH